ncbi:ComF family protein [Nocardia lasii]|uniref:ComF family protein n=1 Tax=Nocardia lasii TaxID=1616107 RepID=A0ABW1JX49_9NOCA
MRALLDLILPNRCGGCDRLGEQWCAGCADQLGRAPVRVRPRADPGIACWALGPYAGVGRRAVLAAKEHGRRDLADPIGLAMARALVRLRAPDHPLLLVPAPTRSSAARRRGGDPVARSARAAQRWLIDCRTAPLLRMSSGVRDSVGLTPRQRVDNLRDKISTVAEPDRWLTRAAKAQVVVVDDVLTTGATACEAVRVLGRIGIVPRAVLVVCAA